MISTSLKSPSNAIEFPPRWIPSEPVTVDVNGQTCRVADVAGQAGVRVAIVGYSPEGARVQVISPASKAGERMTLPEDGLKPVRQVKLHWENYLQAWRAEGVKVTGAFFGLVRQADGFLVFYMNSIFVSICVTLGVVFTSSLAAFAFARLQFPGRDSIFVGYLATLMVPAIVIMLPVYALLSQLQMTNTYTALVFPMMFSAYGTFLLRQFFMSIPRELEDAAVIDGASPFAVYRYIIIPLSKPALATLTTFAFLHCWNDFLWPLMVVDRLALKTLPIGLAHFQDSYTTEYHLLMAASVIVMVPVLIVFLIGQRYFVRGIVLSGMKG
jgi:multiple sugar transport system permease protein